MKFDETMISGYIDDELTDEERAVVERRLAESPKDRELLKTLSDLHQKLSAMPEEIFQQDPVAGVRQRIAAQRLQGDANVALLGKVAGETTEKVKAAASKVAPHDSIKAASANSDLKTGSRFGRGVWIGALAMAASLLAIVASWQWRENATMAFRDAPSGLAGRIENQPPINAPAAAFETEVDESTMDALPLEVAPLEEATSELSESPGSSDSIASSSAPKAMLRGTSVVPGILGIPGIPGSPGGAASAMSFAAPDEASDPAESTANLQLLAFADQATTSAYFRQADAPFDEARSIGVEVPLGWTDDALRLIRDYVDSGAPSNRPTLGRETAGRETADDTEVELLAGEFPAEQSQTVAVLVDASPEQLAGLIQAMRQWARQADRESSPERESDSGAAVMIAGAENKTAATRPTVAKTGEAKPDPANRSLAADLPGRDSRLAGGDADVKETLQLGVEAGAGVREGRIWIIIRPAQKSP